MYVCMYIYEYLEMTLTWFELVGCGTVNSSITCVNFIGIMYTLDLEMLDLSSRKIYAVLSIWEIDPNVLSATWSILFFICTAIRDS